VGNGEQAHDLIQDTFHDAWLAACRGVPPFGTLLGPNEDMRRWLFQAAYHRAISLLRRRRLIRFGSLEERGDDEQEMPGSGSFETALAERETLHRVLRQLTPPDVVCLLLRVVQGFSAAEAAAILETTPDNVNKRLSRGPSNVCVLRIWPKMNSLSTFSPGRDLTHEYEPSRPHLPPRPGMRRVCALAGTCWARRLGRS
jgi:RNA polymerase sigma factor (sigma-70 family)